MIVDESKKPVDELNGGVQEGITGRTARSLLLEGQEKQRRRNRFKTIVEAFYLPFLRL